MQLYLGHTHHEGGVVARVLTHHLRQVVQHPHDLQTLLSLRLTEPGVVLHHGVQQRVLTHFLTTGPGQTQHLRRVHGYVAITEHGVHAPVVDAGVEYLEIGHGYQGEVGGQARQVQTGVAHSDCAGIQVHIGGPFYLAGVQIQVHLGGDVE